MKFGKTVEQEYLATGANLPSLEYCALKKIVKQLVGQETWPNPAVEKFFARLTVNLRRMDLRYRAAARTLLFAASGSGAARLVAVCSRLGKPQDLRDRAKALDAWAALSRVALRKILKKFHKQCPPSAAVCVMPEAGVAFLRSHIRTQIEAMACCALSSDDATCPVCLEALFEPLAPRDCGHAMCKQCYVQLRRSSELARCPVCRGPAQGASPLPVLGRLARSADPEAFERRAQQEAQEREEHAARELIAREAERFARGFARRARMHPRAVLIN